MRGQTMKSTKRHFTLSDNEYLITGNSHDSSDYKILYKGKELKDVIAIVRMNL